MSKITKFSDKGARRTYEERDAFLARQDEEEFKRWGQELQAKQAG